MCTAFSNTKYIDWCRIFMEFRVFVEMEMVFYSSETPLDLYYEFLYRDVLSLISSWSVLSIILERKNWRVRLAAESVRPSIHHFSIQVLDDFTLKLPQVLFSAFICFSKKGPDFSTVLFKFQHPWVKYTDLINISQYTIFVQFSFFACKLKIFYFNHWKLKEGRSFLSKYDWVERYTKKSTVN